MRREVSVEFAVADAGRQFQGRTVRADFSADELIIAHTNESEYKSFIANKKNEALQSRMIVMPIPYNLRVSEEEKIYAKLIGQSDMRHVHIAPHALRAAAIFSILTR